MRLLFLICVLLASLATGPAGAAATSWQDLGGGEGRMLALMDPATGRIDGAVEIRLKPGWKTYWRDPGGTGIPPQLDFKASESFLPGEIEFPAPALLETGGVRFAGYRDHAYLLFSGQAEGVQGSITLQLLIGLCEQICIPAQAEFEIELAQLQSSDSEAGGVLQMARGLLPGEAEDDLRIIEAHLSESSSLRVTAALPSNTDPDATALFVEDAPGVYFAPARAVEPSPGGGVFELPVPEGSSLAGQTLRFTLTAGGRAVEQRIKVRQQGADGN